MSDTDREFFYALNSLSSVSKNRYYNYRKEFKESGKNKFDLKESLFESKTNLETAIFNLNKEIAMINFLLKELDLP